MTACRRIAAESVARASAGDNSVPVFERSRRRRRATTPPSRREAVVQGGGMSYTRYSDISALSVLIGPNGSLGPFMYGLTL